VPLRLFEQHPDVLAAYQKRYEYVCIDEYQDTNAVQMKLAKLPRGAAEQYHGGR